MLLRREKYNILYSDEFLNGIYIYFKFKITLSLYFLFVFVVDLFFIAIFARNKQLLKL